jgi:hypothetical protein
MPRFVVLEHDHPSLHWDLMLETGPVLRSWRLAAPPQPGAAIPASPSFGHRLLYLDYEGPVSGNRGRVVRWDAGTFTWVADEPKRVAVLLHGQHLHGIADLVEGEGGAWCLTLRAAPEEGHPPS